MRVAPSSYDCSREDTMLLFSRADVYGHPVTAERARELGPMKSGSKGSPTARGSSASALPKRCAAKAWGCRSQTLMSKCLIDPARALVLSLKPRFAEAILDGTKTVEVRRVMPRITIPTLSATSVFMASRWILPLRSSMRRKNPTAAASYGCRSVRSGAPVIRGKQPVPHEPVQRQRAIRKPQHWP